MRSQNVSTPGTVTLDVTGPDNNVLVQLLVNGELIERINWNNSRINEPLPETEEALMRNIVVIGLVFAVQFAIDSQ